MQDNAERVARTYDEVLGMIRKMAEQGTAAESIASTIGVPIDEVWAVIDGEYPNHPQHDADLQHNDGDD